MKDFRQNVITERFIEIYQELINKHIITTPTEFSRKLGTTPQNFYQIQKGLRNVTIDLLISLQENMKDTINIYYLFGYGKPLLIPGESNLPIYNISESHVSEHKPEYAGIDQHNIIPLYNIDIAAGRLDLFNDNKEQIIAYLSLPGFRGCTGALYVFGDSMYPLYQPGDIIVCKELQDKKMINFGQTYVIILPDERYLKYVKRSKEDKCVTLSSHNPHYEDWSIPIDSIKYLYEVKGLVRKTGL